MVKLMVSKLWQTIFGTATTGHVLTAGTGGPTFQAASGGGDTKAVLAADFEKTNTVMEDVPDFSFAIAANEKWICTYYLFITIAEDSLLVEVSGPASPTIVRLGDASNTRPFVSAFDTPVSINTNGYMVALTLVVHNGSTPGTCQLRAAKDAFGFSLANTIKSNSSMVAQKVSA